MGGIGGGTVAERRECRKQNSQGGGGIGGGRGTGAERRDSRRQDSQGGGGGG